MFSVAVLVSWRAEPPATGTPYTFQAAPRTHEKRISRPSGDHAGDVIGAWWQQRALPKGGLVLSYPLFLHTPLVFLAPDDGPHVYLQSLDDRVRPKRFYLAPGETSYRVEAIHEHDAWRNDKRVQTPTWRLGRAISAEEPVNLHMQHLERAYGTALALFTVPYEV